MISFKNLENRQTFPGLETNRTQTVIIESEKSTYVPVESGVP
jgi:hypothetical protein